MSANNARRRQRLMPHQALREDRAGYHIDRRLKPYRPRLKNKRGFHVDRQKVKVVLVKVLVELGIALTVGSALAVFGP